MFFNDTTYTGLNPSNPKGDWDGGLYKFIFEKKEDGYYLDFDVDFGVNHRNSVFIQEDKLPEQWFEKDWDYFIECYSVKYKGMERFISINRIREDKRLREFLGL